MTATASTTPTPPAPPSAASGGGPRLGPVGWLRWGWRQLTSMRTALFLLMLLAVGAVPGSIFPQRSIDPGRVADYIAANPTVAPWLDRLSFFDVFASPWFSAIYLLLVVSLLGCIVPRVRAHWAAVRTQPPRAPARLDRLSAYAEGESATTDPAEVLDRAEAVLRRRGYRVARHDQTSLSAETGYLRETGNLVFHIGICAIIIGVAYGYLLGWRGDVIVPAGSSFASTVSTYDTITAGPLVDTEAIPPFQLTLDDLRVAFEEKIASQLGAPRAFQATVTTVERPGAAPVTQPLNLNAPVVIDGADVYLLGNGYAPVVTVRDSAGTVLYREATPFLPQDGSYRSVGTVKVVAAAPKELGLSGLFLPTADPRTDAPVASIFPDLRNPELVLAVFEGTLFPGGRAQSVYTLNTAEMTPVKNSDGSTLVLRMRPGDTLTLPGGRGSVTFEKVIRWAGISVREDPGKPVTFVAALTTVAALFAMLLVRRRRVFVRVGPRGGMPSPAGAAVPSPTSRPSPSSPSSPDGITVVRVGAIAKTADAALEALVTSLRDDLTRREPKA
ncbi:MAG: cytochrome c biogenesis protein ResB [Dermatophilaceae bacterium]